MDVDRSYKLGDRQEHSAKQEMARYEIGSLEDVVKLIDFFRCSDKDGKESIFGVGRTMCQQRRGRRMVGNDKS